MLLYVLPRPNLATLVACLAYTEVVSVQYHVSG